MKKLLLAAIILTTGFTAQAQDFKDVLTKTFTAFDTTWVYETKLQQANKLNLIARKFNTEWAAQYYAAYAQTQLSFNEAVAKDVAKRDALLDEAGTYLAEAIRLAGKETDETHVLAAMIANARIGIDPQKRWQKYGKVFDSELDAAKEINPDNPRMFILKGISKRYTPKFFGGGKAAAKPYFEKAIALLAKESKDDILKPYWGTQMAGWFMKEIEGKDEE